MARCSDALERLPGRPVAGLHGPLHIPAPGGGGLGRGPLDRADRLAQGRAEVEQAARSRVRVVAAPGPFAVGPAAFDDAPRLGGGPAEVTPEFRPQGTVPLLGRPPPGYSCRLTLKKGEDDARSARLVGQAAVVGHPGRPHLGDELAVQAVATPE